MAKATEAKPEEAPVVVPPTWNPEDIALLAEQLDVATTRVSNVEADNAALVARINKLEGDVAILDPQRTLLPSEIVKGLSPADAFRAALSAGITALIINEPHIMNDSKHRLARINKVLETCDTVLEAIAIRAGTKPK